MIAKIILIALGLMGLGLNIGKHGESKGNYNVWSFTISMIITFWLYYYAGIFDFTPQC